MKKFVCPLVKGQSFSMVTMVSSIVLGTVELFQVRCYGTFRPKAKFVYGNIGPLHSQPIQNWPIFNFMNLDS